MSSVDILQLKVNWGKEASLLYHLKKISLPCSHISVLESEVQNTLSFLLSAHIDPFYLFNTVMCELE
ncbi:MAG TPA: hypothetical protein VK718_12555 [Ferruginibacter sp.]|jgi:hypothetical protein|nr:hypothetical protein [Ferruginibacter sp.]